MDGNSGVVTMRTVAKRAGVSVMTVSRVLRNDPRVAEATRQQVLQAARELGYRPNPLVSALMVNLQSARGHRDQTIAFLTCRHPQSGNHRNSAASGDWKPGRTFSAFQKGAFTRADSLGFRMKEFSLDAPGMTDARMGRILRSRGINAIVVAPLAVPGRRIDLPWEHFSASAIGYSLGWPMLHRALNHQMHSIRIALAELTARGYRRIGLAMEKQSDERVDNNWLAGLLLYQSKIPQRDRVPPFLPAAMTQSSFNQWRERHRPDVVVSVRLTVLHWLKEAGVRVPEEVGFAILSYYPVMGPVAGIDQNTQEAGAAAIDLVVEQLYLNKRGIPVNPKSVLIEGEWVEGPTVRPRAGVIPPAPHSP